MALKYCITSLINFSVSGISEIMIVLFENFFTSAAVVFPIAKTVVSVFKLLFEKKLLTALGLKIKCHHSFLKQSAAFQLCCKRSILQHQFHSCLVLKATNPFFGFRKRKRFVLQIYRQLFSVTILLHPLLRLQQMNE